MRIVLDTNILVSGTLTPLGTCGQIVELVIEGVIELCVDGRILTEYDIVLNSARLGLDPADVEDILQWIRDTAEPVVAMPLAAKLPHKADLPFLEVAAAAGTPLVTGNRKHFPRPRRFGVTVLSPAQLLDRLRRRS